MFRSVFGLLIWVLIGSSLCFADKLCLKVSVNKKSGKVTTSRSIAENCPKGFSELMDTDTLSGPRGPAGSINLATCHTIMNQDSLISGFNDVTSLSLACNPNEFLLTHAGSTNDVTTSVISTIFQYYSGESFPSGVIYYFARLEPQNVTTVSSFASAVCCGR